MDSGGWAEAARGECGHAGVSCSSAAGTEWSAAKRTSRWLTPIASLELTVVVEGGAQCWMGCQGAFQASDCFRHVRGGRRLCVHGVTSDMLLGGATGGGTWQPPPGLRRPSKSSASLSAVAADRDPPPPPSTRSEDGERRCALPLQRPRCSIS